MNVSVRLVLSLAIAIGAANLAFGQVNSQPTPDPIVTAQNEPWYLNGEPVAYAGHLYYPTGPQVYFNRYEMVRSGFTHGIPLYTRTTIEPYSMVFVPIGGGLMQPYERRREGDVAGTVGSTVPSFPGTRPYERASETLTPAADLLMAASPPTRAGEPNIEPPAPAFPPRERSEVAPAEVGTSGREVPPSVAEIVSTASHRLARRPGSPNAVFIAFEGSKYFSSGSPVLLDSRFVRVGEYQPVTVLSEGCHGP